MLKLDTDELSDAKSKLATFKTNLKSAESDGARANRAFAAGQKGTWKACATSRTKGINRQCRIFNEAVGDVETLLGNISSDAERLCSKRDAVLSAVGASPASRTRLQYEGGRNVSGDCAYASSALDRLRSKADEASSVIGQGLRDAGGIESALGGLRSAHTQAKQRLDRLNDAWAAFESPAGEFDAKYSKKVDAEAILPSSDYYLAVLDVQTAFLAGEASVLDDFKKIAGKSGVNAVRMLGRLKAGDWKKIVWAFATGGSKTGWSQLYSSLTSVSKGYYGVDSTRFKSIVNNLRKTFSKSEFKLFTSTDVKRLLNGELADMLKGVKKGGTSFLNDNLGDLGDLIFGAHSGGHALVDLIRRAGDGGTTVSRLLHGAARVGKGLGKAIPLAGDIVDGADMIQKMASAYGSTKGDTADKVGASAYVAIKKGTKIAIGAGVSAAVACIPGAGPLLAIPAGAAADAAGDGAFHWAEKLGLKDWAVPKLQGAAHAVGGAVSKVGGFLGDLGSSFARGMGQTQSKLCYR